MPSPKDRIIKCLYRPFDERWCLYDAAFIDRPRRELLRHVVGKDNLCLGVGRQGLAVNDPTWSLVAASAAPIDANIFTRGGINIFPLYLYPDGGQDAEESLVMREDPPRRANFASQFAAEFAAKMKLRFLGDGAGDLKKTFGPEDIFHYAYAVFHSPGYRARYAEFLRMDFPRLPLTENIALFRLLAAYGAELTALHLLRKDGPDQPSYPVAGTNAVEAVRYFGPGDELPVKAEGKVRHGRVYLNAHQYFDGVPPEAWAFPIGGYQPAEKWLKDRKGRALTYEEQTHYPRLIAALIETRRLMAMIESTIDGAGGWPMK